MIEFLITSLIFFFLGRYSVSEKDFENIKNIAKKFKKHEVGAVKRITAEELEKIKDKKYQDEEEAMSKIFDKIL